MTHEKAISLAEYLGATTITLWEYDGLKPRAKLYFMAYLPASKNSPDVDVDIICHVTTAKHGRLVIARLEAQNVWSHHIFPSKEAFDEFLNLLDEDGKLIRVPGDGNHELLRIPL
jgi:hypothetical protein